MDAKPSFSCASCGESAPLHLLDSKPTSLAGSKNAALVCLGNAAWANEDFDRLECARCYGPGFVKGKPDEAGRDKSKEAV